MSDFQGQNTRWRRLAKRARGSTCILTLLCQAHTPAAETNSILLAVEGRVEVAHGAVVNWMPGRPNETLAVGDRIRTGMRSRATLRLSDLSIMRLDELTTIEVRPPRTKTANSFESRSGSLYFFNRERPSDVQFRTPLASGAIRGTEFNLTVMENGRTELTLLDGIVDLSNGAGQVTLTNGEQGVVEPGGGAPRKTAVLNISAVIQWALYYPGVLDPSDAQLTPLESGALSASLAAYRSGDLLAAEALYPPNRQPASDGEKAYRAATLLAVGRVNESERVLNGVNSRPARALRQIIAVVKKEPVQPLPNPSLTTEWMAESYRLQSLSRLGDALEAARQASSSSPRFGFAWARQAELELSFGLVEEAKRHLEKALSYSPRNAEALALRGFAFAADRKFDRAAKSFDDAIVIDPALGNAWLGRGLIKIRRGHVQDGRADLQTAAAVEPQRSILRSYLGKAWDEEWDGGRAEKELRLAQRLDPGDPTPWLYLALVEQQDNRVNEAVADLQKSQELNDNRSLFRSRLLLDEDRAVRSANRARIYQDVGMFDWSLREASRAVGYDYANYSAHQFLANSYDALREPTQINLRYESPALSEYFIANLLSPVGATPLSTTLSQQEYTRLFDRNRAGVASSTEYFSNGDWIQRGSQFGVLGGMEWSLDTEYVTFNGQRRNNDFEKTVFTGRVKQELTPADTLYIEAQRLDTASGDVLQYYSQTRDPSLPVPFSSSTLRVREVQEPNLFVGYHHEWSPSAHTLFLAGRVEDDIQIDDPARTLYFFRGVGPKVTGVELVNEAIHYRRDFEEYSAEFQQVVTVGQHTLIAGGRFQYAFPDTLDTVYRRLQVNARQDIRTYLDRETVYAYDQWTPWRPLQIQAGLSYDRLRYPENIDTAPISESEQTKNQVSPKVGVIWTATDKTHLRGAFTRSLGGFSLDTSYRLEPTQIGGFNQLYRSIAPESSVGLVPGNRFETFSLGLDHELPTRTYVNVDAEVFSSEGARLLGVMRSSTAFPLPDRLGGARQTLDFEERSVTLSVNQLAGKQWAFGMRYRLSEADLHARFPAISPALDATAHINQDIETTLQQVTLYAIWNLPCGFFAQAEGLWTSQDSSGYVPALGGESFWQANAFVGYRWWQRRAEVRAGLLNITDEDYRLNPLILYSELPRERTFYTSFKFYF